MPRCLQNTSSRPTYMLSNLAHGALKDPVLSVLFKLMHTAFSSNSSVATVTFGDDCWDTGTSKSLRWSDAPGPRCQNG